MEGLPQKLNVAEILNKAEVSRGGTEHLEIRCIQSGFFTNSSCVLENMIFPALYFYLAITTKSFVLYVDRDIREQWLITQFEILLSVK